MIPFIMFMILLTAMLVHTGVFKSRTARTRSVSPVLANNFIDTKALYVQRFKTLPSVIVVTELDVNQAFAFIKDLYRSDVVEMYQHNHFSHDDQQVFFNMVILVLNEKRTIEIGNGYVEILYIPDYYGWANTLATKLSAFRIQRAAQAPVYNNVCVTGFAGNMN